MQEQPNDIDAERSVLGGCMLDSVNADEVLALIEPDDMYTQAHRLIFQAIHTLAGAGEIADEVSVAAELKQSGSVQQAGGIAYLASLTERVPTAANLMHHARIVLRAAKLRALIAASAQATRDAYAADADPSVLGDTMQRSLVATMERGADGPRPASKILPAVMEQMERAHRAGCKAVTGVSTGLADLDTVTSGLQARDLIVVAGRPSMGKTALAMGIAQHLVTGGGSALVCSLEMSAESLVMRATCSAARVSALAARRGMLRDCDWPRISKAVGALKDSQLWIDDTGTASVLDIRARARKVQKTCGLDLLVVDYLQLMRSRTRAESRQREIAEISHGLKTVAKDLVIPVIAVCQLNRSVEMRQDKHPLMSDLRDSGAIEQDADLIMLLFREEYYDAKTQKIGIAEIEVAKHRNGPTGTVEARWSGELMRFDNLERSET
jgi:replicative DNA helicase